MSTSVIGAGIIGASITYHLKKLGYNDKIDIYDKLDAPGEASTSLSAGGARNLWSTPVNLKLTTESLKRFANFKEETGRGIGYENIGYLFCLYEDEYKQIEKFLPEWHKLGVNAELIPAQRIPDFVPNLMTDIDDEFKEFLDINPFKGALWGKDCCAINPTSYTTVMLECAKEMGEVKLHFGKEVEKIIFTSGKVQAIEMKDGNKVHCDCCILSAGAWSGELMERSGLNISIVPIKRMLFTVYLPEELNFKHIPMTIIDKGVYFRVEAGNLIVGRAKEDQEPGFDITVEKKYYEDEMNPYMQARIPKTEYCRILSCWGGLYAVTPDNNAIIGKYPGVEGLYLITGFSGHGIMEAPAAGQALAELITDGDYKTIDLSSLSIKRFEEGNLIKETIVI
ncbi:FAD-binding oxidoreductase [candidate division WOR-3 bacterium]|nr:FAD-binding oxidoreductase [candidate division WOR-3 bacterium]